MLLTLRASLAEAALVATALGRGYVVGHVDTAPPGAGSGAAGVASMGDDTLTYGRFGQVVLYRHAAHPARLILFVSGDGGWNLGVVGMARELATMDALVVGIDIRTYLAALAKASDACSDAADLAALGPVVEARAGLAATAPLLVGYSSGATLVYAALAQAPPGTFAGAISLGFCPDLPLTRPLCRGSGLTATPLPRGSGYTFGPVPALSAPWVALQWTIDETCFADSTRVFVRQVPGGELVLLPKVGHGFGVTRRWMPQLRAAVERVLGGRR